MASGKLSLVSATTLPVPVAGTGVHGQWQIIFGVRYRFAGAVASAGTGGAGAGAGEPEPVAGAPVTVAAIAFPVLPTAGTP